MADDRPIRPASQAVQDFFAKAVAGEDDYSWEEGEEEVTTTMWEYALTGQVFEYDPGSDSDSDEDGDGEGLAELSYEQLLALDDSVHREGLSAAHLRKLKRVVYKDGKEGKECSICLSAFQRGDMLTRLHCSHTFHSDCIAKWLKEHKTCPYCRDWQEKEGEEERGGEEEEEEGEEEEY